MDSAENNDAAINEALTKVDPIVTFAEQLLAVDYAGDGRNFLAGAFAIQAFEHWNAILFLVS